MTEILLTKLGYRDFILNLPDNIKIYFLINLKPDELAPIFDSTPQLIWQENNLWKGQSCDGFLWYEFENFEPNLNLYKKFILK